jgi:phosphate transport system permease protein
METQIDMGRKSELMASRAASQAQDASTGLLKHSRIGEAIIRAVLMFCGLFSILITIGIVFVLTEEASRFFTSTAWINISRRLAVAVEADQSLITIGSGMTEINEGDILRLETEQVRVQTVAGEVSIAGGGTATQYTVERGYGGTRPIAHSPGLSAERAEQATIGEFLGTFEWEPTLNQFGIWPLVVSTLLSSAIAMMVAVPLGLSAAIYLSEYASPRTRNTVKPILELLAGIPTVVYGFFALTFLTPLLQGALGSGTVENYNIAAAGLIMGMMILPTISSMSEDALSAVPRSLREASYGLGATKNETIRKVILPAALSGIIAAFILGVSRAVGETMIVAVAAGAVSKLTLNPFEGAYTMTSYIASMSKTDLSTESLAYLSIFAVGLMLFIITLALNLLSRYLTARFREVYQ